MPVIENLTATEILDSRGTPTVKATCTLRGGAAASASVPSGASTGTAEAHELRDGDPKRYRGQGCRKAVANVNGEIADALRGSDVASQGQLDQTLIALDGTGNKSRLGANAILAVSIAFARAVAVERGLPLYEHFAAMVGRVPDSLPRMTINLFSGGKHAGGQMPIQDILIVPRGSIEQGLADAYAIYQAAADLTREKYGTRALTADEGGLAPPFPSVEAALQDAVESIHRAGLSAVDDVNLAIDVASSHFFHDGHYVLGEERLTPPQMIWRLETWARSAPIISIEDGLSEDDWAHWPDLRRRLGGGGRLVLGDDFLCTNPARIRRAVEANAANALLLKVNQIGTLTEAAEALNLARGAGWRVTISARSGETEDNWLADLAVGWGGDQIKVGSITQSERLAKYNRLLEIEAETGLPVVEWPGTPGQ
jgi:enolase